MFRFVLRNRVFQRVVGRVSRNFATSVPRAGVRNLVTGFAGLAGLTAGALYLQQKPSKADAVNPYHPPTYFSPEDQKKRQDFIDTVAPLKDGTPNWDRKMVEMLTRVQNEICSALESFEPSKRFLEERAHVKEPHGSISRITRVLQDGATFEKAGCSISVIKRDSCSPKLAQQKVQMFPKLQAIIDAEKNGDKDKKFPVFVAGVSLVFHPVNPYAPTVHANYRYFEIDVNGEKVWWYGGGSDLTPHYLFEEDAVYFHNTIKTASDKVDPRLYPAFKHWADNYFYNPLRGEHRGIGGIFFDNQGQIAQEKMFDYVQACSGSFVNSYFPIVRRRKDSPYGPNEVRWQQLRHGRYVEFNLLFDEGTKFGFAMPNPNTEAILMSLPRDVRWEFKHSPVPGSAEDRMRDVLTKAREWAQPGAPQIAFAPRAQQPVLPAIPSVPETPQQAAAAVAAVSAATSASAPASA